MNKAKKTGSPRKAAAPTRKAIVVTVPNKLLEERRAQDHHLIGALVKAASDMAGTDVDKMERLWMMHKEAQDRRSEQEFGVAKVALAMELPPIPKRHKIEFIDKHNKTQSTPYADRGDIEAVLDPLCQRHGFSKEYTTRTIEGRACQVLTVRHASGHKEVYESPYMPLDTTGSKNNNQAAGSTAEYGKRYALIGAFNIIGVDKDDDGNLGAEPEDKSKDKFAAKVSEQAAADPAAITDEEKLHIAANQLTDMLGKAPSLEKRGEILMKNIKILSKLESGTDEMKAQAVALRKLAEEVPANGHDR